MFWITFSTNLQIFIVKQRKSSLSLQKLSLARQSITLNKRAFIRFDVLSSLTN